MKTNTVIGVISQRYLETMQISYFFFRYSPLILVFTGRSFLQWLLLWYSNENFVSPSLLQLLRKIFPFPVYFLYQYEFIDIYLILWAVIQYYLIMILLRLFQLWPLGVLISWFLCPLDGILIFLKHIFIFWHYIIQVELLILRFSLP